MTSQGRASAIASLRRPAFARFWVSSLVSNLGTWMQNLSVPYAILQMTGSPAWVGVTAFAQLGPSVLAAPVGGALADRWDRRKLLLASLVVQAAMTVVLGAAWQWQWPPIAFVAVVAVSGSIFGATVPLWYSLIGDLVAPSELRGAITINAAQFNTARAVGPAVAGIVLAVFGPGAAFLLNGLSFVLAFVLFLGVRTAAHLRPDGADRNGFWSELLDGARYAWTHPEMGIALVLVLATALLPMPISQLLAVFARDVYEVGAGVFGLLAATYGAGALMGAVGLVFSERRWGLVQVVQGGLFVFGAATFGLALTSNAVAGGFLLVVCGMGLVSTTSSLNTLIQMGAPTRYRGRLLALYSASLTAGLATGALVQGALADRFGVRPVVAGAAIAYLGLALVVSFGGIGTRLERVQAR